MLYLRLADGIREAGALKLGATGRCCLEAGILRVAGPVQGDVGSRPMWQAAGVRAAGLHAGF